MKYLIIRTTYIFLTFIFLFSYSYAQETEKKEKNKKEDKPIEKPVKHTFESDKLINLETIETLRKKSFQFQIQHRFGSLEKEFEPNQNFDFLGMFAPANIRIGLNYGLTKKLTIGFGATKNRYLYDFNLKYKILSQTKSGSMPISLSYYGNFAYLSDVNFETRKETSDYYIFNNSIKITKYYSYANRLSYFSQLIIARKFNDNLSLQIAPAYSHFNLVESLTSVVDSSQDSTMTHDNFSISFSGQLVVSPQSAIIFEISYPITTNTYIDTKPDIGIGYQISTGAHAFQVVISTANTLVPQYNTAYNVNDFGKGQIMLGFNIVRRWQF